MRLLPHDGTTLMPSRDIIEWLNIDLDLVQLHQSVRREVGRLYRKRKGKQDLKAALAEWKADVRTHADRLNNTTYPPSLAELLSIHQRAIRWHWHWAQHFPDPTKRQRFAEMALEREASLTVIMGKKTKGH
jgi:hypothetical protein